MCAVCGRRVSELAKPYRHHQPNELKPILYTYNIIVSSVVVVRLHNRPRNTNNMVKIRKETHTEHIDFCTHTVYANTNDYESCHFISIIIRIVQNVRNVKRLTEKGYHACLKLWALYSPASHSIIIFSIVLSIFVYCHFLLIFPTDTDAFFYSFNRFKYVIEFAITVGCN